MARISILDLSVGDLMSKRPVTAGPDEELSKVLGKMKKYEVHEVPVVEGKRLLGMVSYSTVLKRRNLPMTTRIDSLLVRPPRVSEDDDLLKVAEILMSSGYRAVPVVRGDRLAGLISRTDLVRAISKAEEFKRVLVKDVMTPDPHTVREEESILKARDMMRDLDERAIPVVDEDNRLRGVVGLKDLVKVFTRPRGKSTSGDVSGEKIPLAIEVKSVMSVPPITVGPEDTAAAAAHLMDRRRISSVVVVEEGTPIGIVTQVDLLERVAALRKREEVYVQISGLEEDDWWTYEVLYTVIGRGLRRIAGIVKPTIFNVHVVTHKSQGDRAKYSIRARLNTENGLYIARDHDWDPYMAMHKVMNQLERQIKREKELRLDRRKTPSEAG